MLNANRGNTLKKIDIAAIVVLSLSIGLIAGPAISAGQNSQISACVSKKTGVMRMAQKCAPSEKKVTWNVQGISGAPGLNGIDGPVGPVGPVGPSGARGAVGPRGDQGLSAFQIAQDNGFVGTESEWLETLSASAPENLSQFRSANFFQTLPNWNSDDDVLYNSQPIVTFNDLEPGTYSLDYQAHFDNKTSAPTLVSCIFSATNPEERLSKPAGSLGPMRFLFRDAPTPGEYRGDEGSQHALVRVYTRGDFSVRCMSLAFDELPDYTSTEVDLRLFFASLVKVGPLVY